MTDVKQITPEELARYVFEYVKDVICKGEESCMKEHTSGIEVLGEIDEILNHAGVKIEGNDFDAIERISQIFIRKDEKSGLIEYLKFQEEYFDHVARFLSNSDS